MKSEIAISNFKWLLDRQVWSYKTMIDQVCPNRIPASTLATELQNNGIELDLYAGDEMDEEGEYKYIYSFYIISADEAYSLREMTNELVYANGGLNVYFLAITHCGTPWSSVEANWKTVEEYAAC